MLLHAADECGDDCSREASDLLANDPKKSEENFILQLQMRHVKMSLLAAVVRRRYDKIAYMLLGLADKMFDSISERTPRMNPRHWQLDGSNPDLARPKFAAIKSSLAGASEFWRDDEDGEVRA